VGRPGPPLYNLVDVAASLVDVAAEVLKSRSTAVAGRVPEGGPSRRITVVTAEAPKAGLYSLTHFGVIRRAIPGRTASWKGSIPLLGKVFFTGIAFGVDLLVGDPGFFTHPVVYVGRLIAALEKRLWTKEGGVWPIRFRGFFLAGIVVGVSYLSTYFLLVAIRKVHPWLAAGLEIWLISTAIAAKSLAQAAGAVHRALVAKDLSGARRAVGQIVGRDTANLAEKEIVRAAVETVAENTVDGVLSPLFYAFLGGAPLAMAFKAVSTLDSMLGYKNQRYLHFGWASARLDDWANYLPARLSLPFLALAAQLLYRRGWAAWSTARLEARKHPSPNSGFPEAAVAGALGVQLGGLNYYAGQPSFRAHLGRPERELEREDIPRAIRLMYLASFLFLLTGMTLTVVFFRLMNLA